jgi:hypothetical protein
MHGVNKVIVDKVTGNDDSRVYVDRSSDNFVIAIIFKPSQVAEMQYRNCRASVSENFSVYPTKQSLSTLSSSAFNLTNFCLQVELVLN